MSWRQARKRETRLVLGDIHDHGSLVKAIKQVDVVISTVSDELVADQLKLIAAIKEAGNIKKIHIEIALLRFLPAVEPAKSMFAGKASIHRVVESANIPHTYVSCNGLAGYFLPTVGKMDTYTAPREKISILGDGISKIIMVKEGDIAFTTIKTVDDPCTLNKTLIFRPPGNTLSFNEIFSIWESKIGKTLEKTYVSEEQLLKNIQEAPFGLSIVLSIMHSVLINGVATKFEIDPSFGVEASELYPEIKYITVDEYLAQLGYKVIVS
ncbi:hypothetical protein L1987_66309 [Smallanthus sonchifolius]|uniref:Uncharacterized protein n=1 Tax=Smallanthus sonchifolius TaxID=185202 RepID=A0ACB9BWR9_9ASTR|nr:hypothetical protein L1987_66309 [Smallanthus sonchifolius]